MVVKWCWTICGSKGPDWPLFWSADFFCDIQWAHWHLHVFLLKDLAISTWCSAAGWMHWWYICAQHLFWLKTLLIIIVSCSCLHAYLVWNKPLKKTVLHITIDFNGLFIQATSGILPMNKWISTGFSATRIRTVWQKIRGFHLTHRWLLPMNVNDLSHMCWLNPYFDWSSPHSK